MGEALDTIFRSLLNSGPYAIMLATVLYLCIRIGTRIANWAEPKITEMANVHITLVDTLRQDAIDKTQALQQQTVVLGRLETISSQIVGIMQEHSQMLATIHSEVKANNGKSPPSGKESTK